MDQWSRIENPEIELDKYAPLIFGKGTKGIPRRKESLFSKSRWTFTGKSTGLHMNFILYTGFHSEWIKSFHARHKVMELFRKENISRV